ncbi:hypothetical protein KP509_33G064300 [Ceratopteris richardii]|uniref:WRKY domain-containing protein n=1 Tax=Ceratopteris richardii TaxID=49495 RepID=A0A8T2QRL9_CERRI|nr:hypothetical protein KP509_33G064300 [Ceratopteris richardii]
MDMPSFQNDDPFNLFNNLNSSLDDEEAILLQKFNLSNRDLIFPRAEYSGPGCCMPCAKRGAVGTDRGDTYHILDAISRAGGLSELIGCSRSALQDLHCLCELRNASQILLSHLSETTAFHSCSHNVYNKKGCSRTCATICSPETDAELTQVRDDKLLNGQDRMRSSEGLWSILVHSAGEQPHVQAFNRWIGPTIGDVESALERIPQTSATTLFAKDMRVQASYIDSQTQSNNFSNKDTVSAVEKHSNQTPASNAVALSAVSSWRPLQTVGSDVMEPRYKVVLKVEKQYVVSSDGYKWRKYGKKCIKGNPYSRSYYRCRYAKCTAKKQVEMCGEGMVQITYDGLHLHCR